MRSEKAKDFWWASAFILHTDQILAKSLPNAEAFLTWLNTIKVIEEEIAMRKNKLDKHLDNWQQIEKALL